MKKKLKRLLALGLAVVFVFGGCSGKNKQKDNGGADVEIRVEEITEPTPTEEVQELPLGVNVSRNYKTYYFDDGETPYLYLQYCDVEVQGTGYENLQRMIEKWSMNRNEELRDAAEELQAAKPEPSESFYEYYLSQGVSIARADEQIVSLFDDVYMYTGGAHPMFSRAGVNFDAKSGKRLALKDIITDYPSFTKEAKNYVITELEANYGDQLFNDYKETLEQLWASDTGLEWYLDASGIVIVLGEYVVGPYVMGTTEIHLPYTSFECYMMDAYKPAVSDGIARLEKNQELQLLLKEGKKPLTLKLEYDYQWETGITKSSLWLNNQKQNLGEFASLNAAYLIRSGEEVFCMVETDMASDDFVTYIFRLTEGTIQNVDQIAASIDAGNINSEGVVMDAWIYFLGTYSGIKYYTIDKKDGFCTEEKEFRLHKNDFVLTTTVDLPVTLEGAESILPAGSRIVLNATDGDTYVKFTIQGTGQRGVLEVTREEDESYRLTIHGMDENDCFEMLPYAG